MSREENEKIMKAQPFEKAIPDNSKQMVDLVFELMDKTVKCLALELPEPVHKSVSANWQQTKNVLHGHAKQVAIEFVEWCRQRYERYATGWVKIGRLILRSVVKPEEIFSTESLYSLFQEETQRKSSKK